MCIQFIHRSVFKHINTLYIKMHVWKCKWAVKNISTSSLCMEKLCTVGSMTHMWRILTAHLLYQIPPHEDHDNPKQDPSISKPGIPGLAQQVEHMLSYLLRAAWLQHSFSIPSIKGRQKGYGQQVTIYAPSPPTVRVFRLEGTEWVLQTNYCNWN